MAGLRDSGGTIVIDEGEAAQDIRNIEEAKAKLAEARRLLDPGRLSDANLQGETRRALGDLLTKACRELGSREDKCGDTKNFIRQTVEKYQRIDRELSGRMRGR